MVIPCGGWGKGAWGWSPWGGADLDPPVVISVSPACGSVNVSPYSPITIRIGEVGCSGLSLDCVRIAVNGVLIYDGTGLTMGVDQDLGFIAPCNLVGSNVYEILTDPVYAQVWLFYIKCAAFDCNSDVSVEGTFCDLAGNVVNLTNCIFSIAPCNNIEGIEIIDLHHILLRFNNSLLIDVSLNPFLYNETAFMIVPVDGGYITGGEVRVKKILVQRGRLPKALILETTKLVPGAAYSVEPPFGLLDIYRQNYYGAGGNAFIARRTKVDEVLFNIQKMYGKDFSSLQVEDGKMKVAPYHLFAALGIEDEKIGGDY